VNIDSLLKFAVLMLMELRGGGSGRVASRTAAGAVCGLFAVLTLGAGMACLITALWIYIAPSIGPAGAALVCGGIFLIVSGGLTLVARTMFGADSAAAPASVSPLLADDMVAQLRRGFEKHKGAALLAALLAGMAAGDAQRK
jgi:hypothetical protein